MKLRILNKLIFVNRFVLLNLHCKHHILSHNNKKNNKENEKTGVLREIEKSKNLFGFEYFKS